MSNLRAEQRPDKNGKIVTRHVKNGDSVKRVASLPAPSPVTAPKRDALSVISDALGQKLDAETTEGLTAYMGMKAPVTQQIVADALERCENDEEFNAISKAINKAIDPGFLQMVTADIKFLMQLSEHITDDEPEYPTRRASGIMESTFTNKFRSRGSRTGMEGDHTKHLAMYQSAVIARVLGVDGVVASDFEAYDQYQHINENREPLMRNLSTCKKAVGMLDELSAKNRPTSEEALAVARVLDDFPGSDDAVLLFIEDREMFDEGQMRESLSVGTALSRGAL
jgi:hypothetical protein